MFFLYETGLMVRPPTQIWAIQKLEQVNTLYYTIHYTKEVSYLAINRNTRGLGRAAGKNVQERGLSRATRAKNGTDVASGCLTWDEKVQCL